MEIINIDKYCIIKPLSKRLDERETQRIIEELNLQKENLLALDLSYVSDCTIDFFEKISKFCDLSIFNIHSDIFTLVISMNLDKTLKLYVSELDFIENKRRMINRQFSLVK